ncbi:penicillin-binding transpeptidase domain-containing protein [[Clostridium] cellulosi]
MLKRSRIAIIVVFVFAVFGFYVFELMQYQVTNGETYRQQNSKSVVNTVDVIAPRGDILDRYGRVLATSKVGYNIILESAFFPSSKERDKQDAELLALVDILKQAGETWEDSLPISTTAPYTFTGTDKDKRKLITFINQKDKKKTLLRDDATADEVMEVLNKLYKTEGHGENEKRILCGIRYEMDKKSFSYTNVYTFAQNVSIETVTKIEERSSVLPGAVVQQVPQRYYPDGTIAPHIIGLTGPIYAEEYEEYKQKGYSADDMIGKFGIEQSMESELHGTNGQSQVELSNNGNIANTLVLKKAQPGNNVILTIDKDLQVTLQNALPAVLQQIKIDSKGNPKYGADVRGAAAVVMNVKTGEVLAMATYPSYDLNTYKKNYSSLSKDKLTPLLNRCISGAYRPGSTFKPLTAAALMMNGVLTPQTKWYTPAKFSKYENRGYVGSDDEGIARGLINVEEALEVSSNVFFNYFGDILGMQKLEKTAINVFGIGKKTGIELNEEVSGSMSGYQYDNEHGFNHNPADAAQAAIGQLYTALTPLQMTNYLSTLLNGGKMYQAHIVKQVNSYDNSKVIIDKNTPTVKSNTKIDQTIVDTIKKGMLAVTEGNKGTAAQKFKDFNMKIGGKTGTAQLKSLKASDLRFNGVFICFAPYDDPEIAVSVVVEHGHWGNQTTPVAREAIAKYFNLDSNGNPLPSSASTNSVGTLLK